MIVDLNRGTGRTTVMLLEAIGWPGDIVVIVSPVDKVQQYILHRFMEITQAMPKGERKSSTMFLVGKKRYLFRSLSWGRDVPNQLRGLSPFRVYWDHTVFQTPFITTEGLRIMAEILETADRSQKRE